jgi:thioredoxin reductase (NADPH)
MTEPTRRRLDPDRPVILAVDDDPAVLRAVARDLRSEYGSRYRVHRAGAGGEALEMLRELRLQGAPVALVLADQRMPGMTGIELLREAIRIYPDVKRVLLTAYADTDVAIRAINEIRLDHYLLKPWTPPEEQLYPLLTDLLDDWEATVPTPPAGIRVIGHRWSADGHRVRDFLARNLVPFQWLDLESSDEAAMLLEAGGFTDPVTPLVVFPDGSAMENPSNVAVAERIGLRLRAQGQVYDLVIVGGGPAGLAAAVYGASEGLTTVLLEREAPGGQAGRSASIENYLGFPVGLSGGDLARRAVAQARRFGTEILTPVEAVGLRSRDGYHAVQLADDSEVLARSVLIATGVSYRLLDVPGAAELAGAGVYYGAAVTEALAAQDQDVFVLGGGNSAGQAAMYLSRFARSVTILVRESSIEATMSSYLVEQIRGTSNIQVRARVSVTEVEGDGHLERVTVRDGTTDTTEAHPAHALFVFIGAVPRTEWLAHAVARDARGYILAGPDLPLGRGAAPGRLGSRAPFWLETSTPGVFVAGDVRHRSIKRVASAVGEGAMAVQFVHQHLGSVPLVPTPAESVEVGAAARQAGGADGARQPVTARSGS